MKSAERSLELANYRYKGGITTYLEVITAQSVALSNERTAVDLLSQKNDGQRGVDQGAGRRLG